MTETYTCDIISEGSPYFGENFSISLYIFYIFGISDVPTKFKSFLYHFPYLENESNLAFKMSHIFAEMRNKKHLYLIQFFGVR